MRYIRMTTPTNIYSLEPTFIVDRTDVTCFKTHGDKGRYVNDTIETEENLEKWLKYNKTSILKQADTIEELCDYFIYNEYEENGNGKLIFRRVFHGYEKDQLKNIMLENNGNIKLGILTNKGLIYVAKINDRGELELL